MTTPADVREFVRREGLQAPSALASMTRSAVVVVAYVGLCWVGQYFDNLLVWAGVWFALSILMTGFFSAMHESTHRNLFKSKSLNAGAAWFWGSLIWTTPALYKAFHLHHHAYTRLENGGPDTSAILSRKQYILDFPHIGIVSFWLGMWLTSLLSVLGQPPFYAKNPALQAQVKRGGKIFLLLHIPLIIALVISPMAVLYYWMIPLFLYYGYGYGFVSLPEHYGLAPSDDPFAITRSMRVSKWFGYIYWDNNYHLEHHLMPNVPYNNSSKLHNYLEDRIANMATYWGYHMQMWKTLKHSPVVACGDTAELEGPFSLHREGPDNYVAIAS